MAITIDGNADTSESSSSSRNFGAAPRIAIALLAIFIAIFIVIWMWKGIYEDRDDEVEEVTRDFVDTFFLAGHQSGEDACSTIKITSSYNSCVTYYDEEFYPTYKEVSFEYTVEIGYGEIQVRPYISIKNPTSTEGNFNFTEIYFQLVHVYNQDRTYVYDSSTEFYKLDDNSYGYQVLFQTIKFN